MKPISNKQKLKSLTWKYFLQQKALELCVATVVILILIFAPLFIGELIDSKINAECKVFASYETVPCGNAYLWVTGLIVLVAGSLILFLLGCLLYIFIEANWDKATERAENKLKSIRKEEKNK